MRFLVQSSSSGRRIARKPRRRHPFGRGGASRKLSFEAFEARHLQRHEFHGNWNYTIPAEPPGETTRPNEGN